MKRLITTFRNYAVRALFLMITLPFFLFVSSLGHASAVVDTGATPEYALFQTESTGETTDETKEEEEEPDC